MTIPQTPTDDSSNGNASPDVLREEAFIWLSRLTDGDVTRPELQAFKRWQHSSPAHGAAFEDAKRQWQAMKPALTGMLHADPKKAVRHEKLTRGRRFQPGRRSFLAASASVAAATVAGVAIVHPPLDLWPAPGEWSADYRTATGEQRAIALASEVSLTLNTQTSVRRRTAAGGATTGIDLLAGEAAIEVADGGRAFSVLAGAGRSLSEAGGFEVRYLDGKVCVTCIKGSVRIEHPAGFRILQANQQTIYDNSAVSGIASIDPANVSAWRKGELVFNQTPLAQVVDEINRYRPGRVMLLATSGRQRPVVGRFPIAVLDEALLQIQHAFKLNARSLPGGLLVLS